MNNKDGSAIKVTLTRHLCPFDVSMIGTIGEGLLELRLLGSVPHRVAREPAITVTTKRYWRLKSMVDRFMGGPG
jgi:hypothetical protein